MDIFPVFLILVGAGAILSLLYLNTVTTVIIFHAPGSILTMNLTRSFFVWLIPFIGFAFALRFTQQSYDCDLHYRLVPKFIQNWVYDDRFVPDNPNADHRWGKSIMLGISRGIGNFRGRF